MNVGDRIDFKKLRLEMIDRAIHARGVRSPLVLEAMRKVPRERFLEAGAQAVVMGDNTLHLIGEWSDADWTTATGPRQT